MTERTPPSASNASPVAKTARAAKPAPKTAEAPRRTKLGDVTGSQLPKRIAKIAVDSKVNARQQAKFAAVRDVLAKPEASKADKANSLRAILEGAAPDDVKAIRRLLKEDAVATRATAPTPTSCWRATGAPGPTPTRTCCRARRMRRKSTSCKLNF
jgi:hypothetical protein